MFNDFYGLSGRPFQLTPDPAFYFESLTHRKALSYLSYGLAQGEGFVVITGEVGAGKSTLVAHLMATVDPARLTAAQIVTSKLDGEELVHVVAQAFGLMVDAHDKANALGAIEAFLHDEARAGRRCLLVVDESQNLSFEALEELRMLSNFQLGAHPLLQTLLLGQPEFRQTIHDHPRLEQLRQRVIAAHHLDAMEPGEIQPYIEHRLRCVGWSGKPSFEPAFFTLMHEVSGGVPRRINQICNRVMMLGAVDHRETIDVATLNQVLDELEHDGTLQLKRPAVSAEASPVPVEPVVAAPAAPAAFAPVATPPIDFAAPLPAGEPLHFAAPPPAEASAAQSEEVEEQHELFAAPVHVAEPAHAVEQVPGEAVHAEPAATTDHVAMAQLQAMLAQRDAHIAELQAAVIELANVREISERASAAHDLAPAFAALEARLAGFEAKLLEQERTIRHTLTMLIEWIEADDANRAAA